MSENKMNGYPLLCYANYGQYIIPKQINYSINIEQSNILYILMRGVAFTNLKELVISGNPLTWFPDIPSLEICYANDCAIQTIPFLPNIKRLYINNNQIRNIPLMNKLEVLECENNMITHIDVMPNLETLSCGSNPLTCIYQPELRKLDATNCPLLIRYDYPNIISKSMIVLDNTIKYVKKRNERIDKHNILFDWVDLTIDKRLIDILKKSNLSIYLPYLTKNVKPT